MKKRLIAILLIMAQTSYIMPTYAYKRSTHQHITELAFAVIKHAEMCQLSDINKQNMGLCIVTCVTNEKLQTENEKLQCVDQCQLDNYPAPSGFTEAEQVESKRFCAEVYGEFLLKYKNKAAPYQYLIKPENSQYTRTNFYQNFNASACPPKQKYQYNLSDIGCKNYDEDLDEVQDGKKLYGFQNQSIQLKLYTRAMHEEKPILIKDDVFYRATDGMGGDPAFNLDYRPIAPVYYDQYGKLSELNITNSVLVNENGTLKRKVDLTGTILGYYAGATDLFYDLYTNVRFLPIVEDVLKTVLGGAVGVVGVGAAAVWVVGTFLVCSVTCIFTGFDERCDACFGSGFSGARESIAGAADAITGLEQENFISGKDGPMVAGHNGTSFFHFMNTPTDYQSLADSYLSADSLTSPFELFSALFDHDDIDGYRAGEAFGVLGGLITQDLLEGAWIDQVVDIRVTFKRSKHSILNYQVINSDDAPNEDSSTIPLFAKPFRNLYYWQRMGLTDYTFPPVDNLAYYWWHVWWDSRAESQQRVEEMGLLPLGAVLHAVQDITQPLHARGITFHGHQSYEEDVDNRMDHTMMLLNRADMRAPLLIDLSTNLGQKEFIKAVLGKFMLLYNVSVNPEGVLDIRKLMHTLYLISHNVNDDVLDDSVDWSGDKTKILEWVLSMGLKALITDDYSSNQGLPYAIAATMLVLLEASREDVTTYELGLNLTNFRNYMTKNDKYFDDEGGTWSSLRTKGQALQGDPSVSYIDEPQQIPEVWRCAGTRPEVERAVSDYIADKMIGRDVLKIVMNAHLACEIREMGLPMPPNDYLERLATLKAGEFESRPMLLSHGDVQRYHKEMACLHKEEWEAAPDDEKFHTAYRYQQLAARCGDNLDSDGDGVLDQDDQCYTPTNILRSPGIAVTSNGCAFDHAYKRGQRLPSLDMPGAKIIRRQQ